MSGCTSEVDQDVTVTNSGIHKSIIVMLSRETIESISIIGSDRNVGGVDNERFEYNRH